MDAKSFRKELRKNQTYAESAFWNIVRAGRFHKLKFRRQHTIDNYTVDFYCPKLNLIIELDGSIHENLGQSLYDEERDRLLKAQGYMVIRLDNDTVLNYPEVVIEHLNEVLNIK